MNPTRSTQNVFTLGDRARWVRICALVCALLAVASFSLAQYPWP